MSRLGVLVSVIGVALVLDLLVYLGSDGMECDTPQGEGCGRAADVSGVLLFPLLAAAIIGLFFVAARRRAT